MTRDEDWVHRRLDGEGAGEMPPEGGGARLARYEDALSLLASCREQAPSDLTGRILAALPDAPPSGRLTASPWAERLRRLWPRRGTWLAPTLAGALASMLVVLLVGPLLGGRPPDRTAVHFEVHAPGAHRVEVVGSFNDWTPGRLVLKGPDATGYWSATVSLPAGRYEYLFLVDGDRWITDPSAPAHRPDGFGRENALIEL